MGARTTLQWIVVIIAVLKGFCFSAFAGPVYTYGGEFDLLIPADSNDSKGWMADAVIEIPEHFTIDDLDVGISLTHESVFDLQIIIESPSGTTAILNAYNPFEEYFEGEDYIGTIFDDEAAISIGQAEPPFIGRYRPKESLSVFDGEDAYGLWRLRIYDAYYADTGSLDSFELIITVPEPATAALLLLGTGFMTLLRPRRGRIRI